MSRKQNDLAANGRPDPRQPLSLIKAILVLVFGASASVAVAQSGCGTCTTPTIYETKAPMTGQLTINVTASVAAQCGFSTAPSGTHNEPNFDDHAWTHSFGFALDCSIPARVGVVSTNGGLLLNSAPPLPTGYTSLAPYSVELNVVRNAGAPANGTCLVADLVSGGTCGFRGPAAVGQGLSVPTASNNQPGTFLRVFAPAYTGTDILPNGNYADTLTVTVSPAA